MNSQQSDKPIIHHILIKKGFLEKEIQNIGISHPYVVVNGKIDIILPEEIKKM